MNSRLPVLALLILSTPLFSQTPLVGEMVRENYVDRIESLRDKVNAAQLELGKLEGERLDASNDFTRANAPNFNFAHYEAQMRSLNNQIEAERSLKAARHAGIPHATD